MDNLLGLNALSGITKALVVANPKHNHPQMEGWQLGIDYDTLFGDYYGVRLAKGELRGEFTKPLYRIKRRSTVL